MRRAKPNLSVTSLTHLSIMASISLTCSSIWRCVWPENCPTRRMSLKWNERACTGRWTFLCRVSFARAARGFFSGSAMAVRLVPGVEPGKEHRLRGIAIVAANGCAPTGGEPGRNGGACPARWKRGPWHRRRGCGTRSEGRFPGSRRQTPAYLRRPSTRLRGGPRTWTSGHTRPWPGAGGQRRVSGNRMPSMPQGGHSSSLMDIS